MFLCKPRSFIAVGLFFMFLDKPWSYIPRTYTSTSTIKVELFVEHIINAPKSRILEDLTEKCRSE